ncbi:MAG TPA: class A beta-lactamase-related serine hydrolase [Selenomonadales bacterium]|nr:class A beta-lactamase-related serine hydrolase [Selenomonadales bacterium]
MNHSLSAEWLADRLLNTASEKQTFYSICVQPLDEDRRIILNPVKMRSASLIKIFIMIEAFRQKKSALLDFAEAVRIDRTVKVEGGSLHGVPDGTRKTVGELVERMIVESDNSAANILIDKLGLENINAMIGRLACEDTALQRKMLDFASAAAGRENYTSVADVGATLAKLYGQTCLDPESDRAMLDILARQEVNDRIPVYLPHDLRIAHKTGELDGALHDCGVVFGRSCHFVLCFMTEKVADEHKVLGDMARMARVIYDALH